MSEAPITVEINWHAMYLCDPGVRVTDVIGLRDVRSILSVTAVDPGWVTAKVIEGYDEGRVVRLENRAPIDGSESIGDDGVWTRLREAPVQPIGPTANMDELLGRGET
jgi:hypothetical protein